MTGRNKKCFVVMFPLLIFLPPADTSRELPKALHLYHQTEMGDSSGSDAVVCEVQGWMGGRFWGVIKSMFKSSNVLA